MTSYSITSPAAASISQPASVAAHNAEAMPWPLNIKHFWSMVVSAARHWTIRRERLVNDHLAPDAFQPKLGCKNTDGLNAHLLRDINAPDWVSHTQARERDATDYELLRAQSQARRFF